MDKWRHANLYAPSNEQPFSMFLVRTWYLHSSTSLLDVERPIRKSHTFVAFEPTAKTNGIGWVRPQIPQIDWLPFHQAHTERKRIWASKLAPKIKEQFPTSLSHQSTLEINKKKSFVNYIKRNKQKLMHSTNWNWSVMRTLDKLSIFHEKYAKREYLYIWLKSLMRLKNKCAFTNHNWIVCHNCLEVFPHSFASE